MNSFAPAVEMNKIQHCFAWEKLSYPKTYIAQTEYKQNFEFSAFWIITIHTYNCDQRSDIFHNYQRKVIKHVHKVNR